MIVKLGKRFFIQAHSMYSKRRRFCISVVLEDIRLMNKSSITRLNMSQGFP